MDYFNVFETTYSGLSTGGDSNQTISGFGICPKGKNVLKGKVTIPNEITYGGATLPIVEFLSTSSGIWSGATHIFFENAKTHELRVIRNDAFQGSTTLKFFEMPAHLRYIGSGTFRGCSNLVVPKFEDTMLVGIEDNAFNTALTSNERDEGNYILLNIALPNTLQYLGNYAFANAGETIRYNDFIIGSEGTTCDFNLANVNEKGPYSRNNGSGTNINHLVIHAGERYSYFIEAMNNSTAPLYVAQDGYRDKCAFALRTNAMGCEIKN
jgi:hypothetical protein